MNRNNSIREIKENLKKLLHFSTEQKFNNFTLTDGTNITTTSTDIEIGAEVYMLDEQGNQTPLDNGDYVLQDGRTFTIADNVVTDIKAPEGDGQKPEQTGDSTTDAPKQEAPVKEAMDANGLPEGHDPSVEGETPAEESSEGDLSARVADLEKQLAEVLNILSKMGDSQNDLNEQMMSAIKTFGSEPGDKPVRNGKRGYEVYDKDKSYSKKKGENSLEVIEMMKNLKKERNY